MTRRRRPTGGERRYWLYGTHAVHGALQNPDRDVHRVVLTAAAARTLSFPSHRPQPEIMTPRAIDQIFPGKVVHQGIAAEVRPLATDVGMVTDHLAAHESGAMVLALDQVSDPQNVGAILRSAWALGAGAVCVPSHGAPPETGALAKAASGALDHVPYVPVGNLAQFLDRLRDTGTTVLGLSADAELELPAAIRQAAPESVVLVLGAEGTGLRRLTKERCEYLARIPVQPQGPSLNVSAAAAIALYAVRTEIGTKMQ